jgi:hypothetical protein
MQERGRPRTRQVLRSLLPVVEAEAVVIPCKRLEEGLRVVQTSHLEAALLRPVEVVVGPVRRPVAKWGKQQGKKQALQWAEKQVLRPVWLWRVLRVL